jgi:DNA-directed RNA polymerase specialized sigma24 family protein
MALPDEHFDGEDLAGPVVRPYAVTGGRTHPAGPAFDLIAQVEAVRGLQESLIDLQPEHRQILRLSQQPTSIADLASDLDLPLGVVRILLADLRERGLIRIRQPGPAVHSDLQTLQEVADGLRKL